MQHSTWDDDENDECADLHENTEDCAHDWDAFDASIRSDDAHWHEYTGARRD
jgi:hypothetical protein